MKVKTCAIKQLNEVQNKDRCAAVLCSSYPSREEYKNGFPYSLFLHFDDVIDENKARSFNNEMAKAVAEFINKLGCNDITDLYFCCDSGRSRSTALAAAFLRKTNRDEFEYWKNPIYNPNILVYKLMCKAFNVPVTTFGLYFRKWINKRALKKAIDSAR